MSAIQAKLDERGKIFNQINDLKNRAKKENRALTEDENTQWDKGFADYKRIGDEIKSIQKEERQNAELQIMELEQKSVFDQSTPGQRKEEEEAKIERKVVAEKWFRSPKSLTSKEWEVLETRGTNTQVTTNDGLGGYIIPDEWQPELTKALIDYSGMLEAGRLVNTSTGRQMHWPKVPFAGGGAAATQKGVRIGENAASVVNDINFQEALLNAYVYSSGEIQWTWEEMQDAMFDVVALTMEIGGERIGMIVNEELTIGTGTSQPNGANTASALGKTAAGAAAITGDELVDLKYSVKRPYRKSNKCGFMFTDLTEAAITKLSYGVGDTAVWVPSFREGTPDKILGHRYWVNDDMPEIATGEKTVLFGDFNKYIIRKAGYPEMARSDERDMANRRSVFYVFARYDGELVDGNAIKHLIQA